METERRRAISQVKFITFFDAPCRSMPLIYLNISCPNLYRSVTKGDNSSISKAFCRCGEGWKCVITGTEGPDAGKAFFNCGENCTCVIYGDGTVTKGAVPQEGEKIVANEHDCECAEGWKCVISKVEGPDAGKGFSECAGDCTCVVAA